MAQSSICTEGKKMREEEYRQEFGEVVFPEGFEEKMKGKSIEEQMEFFRIKETCKREETSYGEVDSSATWDRYYRLNEYRMLIGIIVKDGILVGVRMDGFWKKNVPLLPNEGVLTYYASDDEGTETSDREDFARLICM